MFRLRSIFSILLVALILPYQGIIPLANARPLTTEASAKNSFVNLYIDEIKILGDVGEFTGPGEFRLIVLAADTTGKSSGMFCPSGAPLKVRKGDTVMAPCLLAVSFAEDKVSDAVYLTVMAMDEDKASLPADITYEAASSYLGGKFGEAVKKGAIKVGLKAVAKSTPFTIAVDALFSFFSGKVRQWMEQADTLGLQGIYLTRKDNWSADKTRTVTSSDGGIRITYTIVRTSSTPPNPKAPVLGSTSSSSQSSPQSSQKYWCDDLKYVRLEVGDRAKVVWPKVNLRTAPIVPEEYYSNSIAKPEEGTALTVIGGPACAHNGTWWQVRTRNGLTGWMREHISTGYLIGH